MNDDRDDGEFLRYSTKEILADLRQQIERMGTEIRTQIETLIAEMRHAQEEQERRVAGLEARIPLTEEIIRRFLLTEATVTTLQERLGVHIAQPGHDATLKEIHQLETEVRSLKENAVAAAELRTLGRWLWGIGLGTLTALVAIAGIMTRLLTGH